MVVPAGQGADVTAAAEQGVVRGSEAGAGQRPGRPWLVGTDLDSVRVKPLIGPVPAHRVIEREGQRRPTAGRRPRGAYEADFSITPPTTRTWSRIGHRYRVRPWLLPPTLSVDALACYTAGHRSRVICRPSLPRSGRTMGLVHGLCRSGRGLFACALSPRTPSSSSRPSAMHWSAAQDRVCRQIVPMPPGLIVANNALRRLRPRGTGSPTQPCRVTTADRQSPTGCPA